jgi:ADP-ribose pyrophosphatase
MEDSMPKSRAKVLSSKMIYQGKVFGVRHDVVMEPGGAKATRDIVTHPGSVVVLPILPDGRIIMIRQYRHTVGDFLLEIVAGRIERGETNLQAAKRELAEETGYRAKHFREMMNVYPTPGFVRETMVAYAATGLTPGKTNPDADERIETKAFTLDALLKMIRKGQIHDAKSIAGILYYARFIAKFPQ